MERGLLQPDAVAEGRIAAGEVHAYRVAADAGDYVRVRLEQRGLDLVLAVTVLCFVDDAARAVGEMGRVLRPSGRLLIGRDATPFEARGVADAPDGAVGSRRHAQQRAVGREHEHGGVEQGIVRKSSTWPDPYPAIRRQGIASVLGVRVADAKLDGDVSASLHAESRRP